ncbi:MAG TPA: hypothetical protein PLF78_08125 [Caulobacter sp.]|nr:hypothetical protein [Caulobacter sp.]
MTTQSSHILPGSRFAGWILVALAAVTVAVVFGPRMLRSVADANPHGPDLALFAAQPLVIKLHVLAALGTVALGGAILSLRKGDRRHRTFGWLWVALMALAAGSSLFIVGLNGDHWSVIHLLSGWTLVMLPIGVLAARRHRSVAHGKAMTGIFVGGSLVAGAFTFLPGRLMWNLFFG